MMRLAIPLVGILGLLSLFANAGDGVDRPPQCGFPQHPRDTVDTLLTLAAVGDVMIGSDYPPGSPLPPNDGAEVFTQVRQLLISADIAFGNLEGPIQDGGKSSKCGPKSTNCYAFRMPSVLAPRLKEAGFDILSIANNHALDFGEQGRTSTMHTLDTLGILYSGPVGVVARTSVKGIAASCIAFSYDEDCYNLNDHEAAIDSIRAEAARCDVLIVSFHGGAEGASKQRVPDKMEMFLGERRGHLRKFTHAAVDAGADIVLGHGPHVMRGMELYNGRLIAYSLGNFATWEQFTLTGPNGIACVLEASLARDGSFVSGKLHPTKQIGSGIPIPDPDSLVIPMVRELNALDFPETGVKVGEGGALLP